MVGRNLEEEYKENEDDVFSVVGKVGWTEKTRKQGKKVGWL